MYGWLQHLVLYKAVLDTYSTMSEHGALEQRSDVTHSESAQSHGDSDDEPMVYSTRKDYAAWARQTRDQLIADGVDPDSIILQSNLRNHVPQQEGESHDDYRKRYVETINDMIRRGIKILNDQCTTEVKASVFGIADGRRFDLGPRSSVTKGEFREFSEWFSNATRAGQVHEVPEKWLKFEKRAEERSEL